MVVSQGMNQGNAKDNEPDMTEVGTIAGRAPAPVVPKPDPDEAPTGSPGAAADREQAKERGQPDDKA
jgi:hypothetical protein